MYYMIFYWLIAINFGVNNLNLYFMKMKNYLKAAFLLVAIVSVWVLKPIEKSQDADPLLLQNVEALASGEDSSQTHCYGRGSVDCPVSHDKVDVVYDSYSLGE